MNELGTEAVEYKWTNVNLLKLLASLKSSIPDGEQMCSYQKGLKTIDWKKVAFPPFSPEECQNKWNTIMNQMRKLRSLTELIVEAEDVISKPHHNRKIHPEIPKKPTQPRNAYFKRHYSAFQKKHPELGVQKIFKLLFKKYEKLSDKKKAEYEEKYTQELIQYRKKMIDFGEQNKMRVPRVKVAHRRTKKDSEDEELPSKPPINGYALFCMENSNPAGGKSGIEVMNSLSQRWRNLSETEKADYTVRHKELMENYTKDLHKYLNRFDEEEQQQIIKKKGLKVPKTKKGRKQKERRPGEPKMPSRVPYAYFAGEQMGPLKDKVLNSRDRLKVVHKLWLQLPMKQKECYQVKVLENLKRYSADLQKWFMTLNPEEQKKYLAENHSKSQFLDVTSTKYKREDLQLRQPSDSEDEDVDSSSSDGETILLSDEEEDEEDDIIMFDII